eukprot:TRINITY_DN5531_c0_g1_i10.p1 TRINITY_DN5531_c0_g1~~TRINITY_DN5531_c0_g1_i10.p1  ORF type:complete len:915 (-),score=202.11 TRINITY_DN5531_c0_g1_i10:693-3437(-)
MHIASSFSAFSMRCNLVVLASVLLLACFDLPFVAAQNGEKEVCATTEFHCYESSVLPCIPGKWRCDRSKDCQNGEDERHCEYNQAQSCAPEDVKCVASGECVPRDWLCDGQADCKDDSDEGPHFCRNRVCLEDEFTCADHGNCINGKLMCDGKPDCLDGSDEIMCGNSTCQVGEMQCGDGGCVSETWRCDGEPDCQDGSDEEHCEEKKCPEGEFSCKNNECVPYIWRCDGHLDCADNSDEEDCKENLEDKSSSCSKDMFRCLRTNTCIHTGWLCDGESDCIDGSDESMEQCGKRTMCNEDEFRCDDGECINHRFNCSGQPECMDGSDERDCGIPKCNPETEFDCGEGKQCIPLDYVCDSINNCGNFEDEPRERCGGEGTCAANNGGCDQICLNTPSGHVCSCHPGYVMGRNNTCEDINECEMYGHCSQVCENTPGSYKCSCFSRYLQDPNHPEKCVAESGVSSIMFTRKTDIRLTTLGKKQKTTALVNGTRSASGLDYHNDGDLLFWSESYDRSIYRTKMHDNLQIRKVIVDGEAEEGLAVDWVYDNLYYVRRHPDHTKTIAVTDFNGKYHVDIVTESIEEPRSLAVKPSRGWLFWSDWGKLPRIEMASMDGSNRDILVTENILWPNGITLDPAHDTLYWVDAKLHTISRVNILTKEVTQILYSASNLYHPYSIAIFEDQVFWTDRRVNSTEILKANKFTGEDVLQQKRSYSVVVPMSLKILHELVQPKGTSFCRLRSKTCSHLCVPAGETSVSALRLPRNLGDSQDSRSVCLCPQGFNLDADGSTCITDGSMPTTQAPTPRPTPAHEVIFIEEERVESAAAAAAVLENADQTLLIAMVVAVTAFVSVACTLMTFFLCKRYKPVSHECRMTKCVVQTKEGYQPPIRATMAKFHESESMVPLQRGSPDPDLDPPV